MGKPFARELDDLPASYLWSVNQSVADLSAVLHDTSRFPLLAVGSGGSLSAAHLAVLLHQRHGTLGKAATPLEVQSTVSAAIPRSAVLFLSAGGRNPDVLSGFRQVATAEPRHLVALCMRTGSPLRQEAAAFRFAHFFDYDLPCGKDGFLATNSLLASVVCLVRAYDNLSSAAGETLPGSYEELTISLDPMLDQAEAVLRHDALLVLYSGWAQPIAVDLESKFSEAALGHVHPADYRNFGHGRHHWLARRRHSTGVIALITPADQDLAERTLALLPAGVPVLRLCTQVAGPQGTVELLVQMLYLIQKAGTLRGIDPGRPGVPEFGRRLYHLKAKPERPAPAGLTTKERTAIRRKCFPRAVESLSISELEYWRHAYRDFRTRLKQARFTSAVIDYDGTLCDPCDRHTGLRSEVVEELLRLLQFGMRMGVATGRGPSVREALLAKIPRDFWQDLLVSYYNGAVTCPLCDGVPDRARAEPCEDLGPVAKDLRREERLPAVADVAFRHWQITIEILKGVSQTLVLDLLERPLREHMGRGGQVLYSAHSIDILPGGISKRALVRQLQAASRSGTVLCIGDRGRWPGNDFDLLQEPFSLSVDEASPDRDTCWNIAPPGHRGVQATLDYLRCLTIGEQGTFIFSLSATKEDSP